MLAGVVVIDLASYVTVTLEYSAHISESAREENTPDKLLPGASRHNFLDEKRIGIVTFVS
jgi:hypothetical protein